MKAVILHFSLLAVLFWCACSVQAPSGMAPRANPRTADSNEWRRTRNGWELRTDWDAAYDAATKPHRWNINLAAVHPVNVALLQGLVSTGALLLLSPAPGARR